jgi:hypothetical protein
LLDKDMLRSMSDAEFYKNFCLAPAQRDSISEYWRSGGTTGRPLFYPRSHRDPRPHGRPGKRLPLFSLRRHAGRRAGALLVSARHPSGRSVNGAGGGKMRHGSGHGGGRHDHAVHTPARADREGSSPGSGWECRAMRCIWPASPKSAAILLPMVR